MYGGGLNRQWQTEITYIQWPQFSFQKLESETNVTLTNNREC